MANNRTHKNYIITELHEQSVLIDKREIFLHTSIHDEADVDTQSSITFLKNVRLLDSENNRPIIIHQHGRGGFINEGLLLYDAIAQCVSPVILIMWGCAYSMSSFIPQAADLRIVTPSCSFMMHEGSINMYDTTVKQAKAFLETDKYDRDMMLNVYANVCINGEYFKSNKINTLLSVKKFLKEKMDKKEDWYLTAKQTVEYGFADAVLGDEGYESIEKIRGIYDSK